MNIRAHLAEKIRQAMTAAGVDPQFDALVVPSKRVDFGDYQANGAMGAAKAMKKNPRELAQSILDKLDLSDEAERLEIAGPGFINIHLNREWLAGQLLGSMAKPALGVGASDQQTIVIDYSSPNLAKEMHVGHLRSTIIGDTLARVQEFLGHKVIRQNHVGDWGTQFGMLIAQLEAHLEHGENAEFALQDLESFYKEAKTHFDADPEFADRARNYVVKLQSGDTRVKALWERFRAISLHHSEVIYDKLNVSLRPGDVRGESFYNDDLPSVVKDLEAAGLLQEDQGAKVVFLDELADKEGNPNVAIVQKKDGGYLYSTSDLAGIRYRVRTLKADRIMIFVDARQSLHFKQVFTIARKAGFAPPDLRMEHYPFGTMLGEDGKPFKTRSGGTVKLADLLDEAVERAEQLIADKDPQLDAEQRKTVARKVGIGAVKYADLSKTRTNDYVFNWNAMLSFDGNTAPYLQYAYTRIQSIFRKAQVDPADVADPVVIEAAEEKQLAIKCLQFGEVLEQVADDAYPHVLCNYLYDLASLYMKFYEACPILKEGVSRELRQSRLRISHSVAETLRVGLDLLGIEVMERM
ncbi:arginine--tRNA ligase [Gilvimarinus sp. F26214L]|uniref:arginine--tRNA ligase n=1 Tax=Gilvimarinus sp. DZF01 TaxID=3461371 RepID=UPI004045FBC5